MRPIILSLFTLLTISQLAYAQESSATWACSKTKINTAARLVPASPAEDEYDVKYVKLDISLTNTSTYINGVATTTAQVLAPVFNAYVFELDSSLVIDSVVINGHQRPVTHAAYLHTATLSSPLFAGDMFTVRVYYNGTSSGSGSIFGGVSGINNMVSPSWGTRITFTQSESYHANEWWPCKQSLHDKIDSLDMWITVPDSMKAGSNGVLKAVTPIDATHVRYEWKERHPIACYLVSVAVAPYVDYSYYMHFSGSEDSMLVQNYVYPNPLTLPTFKDVIDSIGMMVDYFSKIYSRYPFWDEKYGHCMAPLSGGMENQTMTTIGYFDASVVAHELGHQWFGDNVTCGTWADIFVNESIASYTEDLFREHFRGHANMIGDIQKKQDNVKSNDSGSVYVDDTTLESRVFDSRLSYHKGACFLHMLRFVINDDSTFFQVYKAYQQEFKTKNGTILDFRNTAKGILGINAHGINLDTFFSQWIYGQGFPRYNVSWNKKGNDVYVRLDQSTTVPGITPFFTQPVEIRLHASGSDTTIRVINDRPGQEYHFTWSRNMNTVILDPNSWLLMDVNTISHDTDLAVTGIFRPATRVYPNPATTGWNIDNLPRNGSMVLTDLMGRVIWSRDIQNSREVIPANGLPTGLYMLRVVSDDGGSATYKLMKE